jgi:hypothetical protein
MNIMFLANILLNCQEVSMKFNIGEAALKILCIFSFGPYRSNIIPTSHEALTEHYHSFVTKRLVVQMCFTYKI